MTNDEITQKFIACREKVVKRKTLKENARKFIIEITNTSILAYTIKLDGCVFPPNEAPKRCDFLCEIERTPELIDELWFIELKGKNINKAMEQILSSLENLKFRYQQQITKKAFVIASRVPLADTKTKNLKVKLRKQQNISLQIKNTKLSVSIF